MKKDKIILRNQQKIYFLSFYKNRKINNKSSK
jgi:hypothetical protein